MGDIENPIPDNYHSWKRLILRYYTLFRKMVQFLSRLLLYLSSVTLFLLMLLTTVDVIGRYVFNAPILGAHDMVELGLVVIAFGTLGYLTSERQHMRADMINALLSKRQNSLLSAVCFIASLLGFAIFLAWQTTVEGVRVAISWTAVTETIAIPLGPFYIFAGVGLILLCLEMMLDIVRYLQEIKGEGTDQQKDSDGTVNI